MTRAGIMPRIAFVCLVLVGGCSFQGNYDGPRLYCHDGMCPSGLECRMDLNPAECRAERMDAAIDMPIDTMGMDADASPGVALDCFDPGILTSAVQVSGNTSARSNRMTSVCSGGVQNAKDAVYKITTTAPNQQLRVAITGNLNAYVLNACNETPNTVACLGSTAATSSASITVTAAAAGNYWIVVDAINPATMGGYGLTVTIQ